MNEEEKKTKLKSLIEDYEIGYKESEYEGNAEEYKSLKETHKLLKDTLNYIDKLQKELEEKTTILMAGADKVKQLEKENEELKEKYENINWYFENQKENFISKDKIRELREIDNIDYLQFKIKELLGED